MYSAFLDCLACRNNGEIELRLDNPPVVSRAYEYLGTSIASGHFYLLCNSCKTVLLVDPVAVINSGKTERVKGIVCRMGTLLYKGGSNDVSDPEKPR